MGFAKSGTSSIWNKRQWQRKAQAERNACGHVWQWDPEDRLMRCYKCGGARLATDVDRIEPRLEGSRTDF